MRSRRSVNDEVAEVARRRLELLSAELAAIRPDPGDPPQPGVRDGSGEPFPDTAPHSPGSSPTAAAASRPGSRSGSLGSSPPAYAPTARPTPGSGPEPGRHAHRSVGLAGRIAGWMLDRLPPTLHGRLRMSAAHLGVVAVLVVGGLGATLWWVSRVDGGHSVVPPRPVEASALPAPAGGLTGSPPTVAAPGPTGGASEPVAAAVAPNVPGTAPPAAPSPTASVTGSIVVDVTGKVRRPGIATLPLGSRVVDALEAAGGARRGAKLGTLNLARVLADGEQIVVGLAAPPGVAASAAAAPTAGATGAATPLVNLNTATQAQLEELPDVGPVTAQSILDFRAENGAFTAVEELLEVSGIGDATLARIAPHVTL